MLGVEVGDSEDGAFWTAFLRGLRARGLTGVQLVISDAHHGLREAISAVMLGATWQRCQVHLARNVLAKVPKGSADMVAAAMRTIYAQPDAAHVAGQFDEIVAMLARQFPDAATILRTPATTSSRSPRSPKRTGARSGRPTRSNASTARSNAAPTSSASSPTTPPSLRLVSAVVAETHDEWQDTERRYLSEHTMALLYELPPSRSTPRRSCLPESRPDTPQPDTQTFTRRELHHERGHGLRRQRRQLRSGQGDAPRVADRKRHPPHSGRTIAPSTFVPSPVGVSVISMNVGVGVAVSVP